MDTERLPQVWEPDADYDIDPAGMDVDISHVILPQQDHVSFKNTDTFLPPSSDLFNNKSDGLPAFSTLSSYHHSQHTPLSDEGDESQDDSEGNPKTFMRVLTRFAERTSMQGVPYINVSRVWYAKLGWAVLFLVGFAAMCFHLYYLIKEYHSYDTHSVVTLGFNTLAFPAVTVCNNNPIKRSQMTETSPALQAFVESVEPSNIAYNMEEKRKGSGGSSGGSGGGGGGTGGGGGEGGDGPPDQNSGPQGDETQPLESDTNQQSSTGGSSYNSDTNPGNQDTPDSTGTNNPSSSSNGDTPKSRRRRFVDGFTISETNTRYQKDSDGDDSVNNNNRLIGNKSTLRAIEDEFKFLYTSMGRDVRASIGHQLEDMLMECSFRGIECDESYFRMTQTAEYGNCYTLERENYISILGGPGDGLNLIFFTQDEEYLHGITNSLGLQVHIHQPGSLANPYEEGIAVSAGTETNVALKQVNIERLQDPHGDCDKGNAFLEKYGVVYTQKTCQQFCVQVLVMSKCQCFDNEKEEMYRRIESYERTNITRPCLGTKETTCLKQVYTDFQAGAIACDCRSPCQETIYTKFLSNKLWPTEQYATILVEHLCNILNDTECEKYSSKSRSDLALSFLKLVLYFEDLNYENITEEPNYELFQFVSDVGGTIGLWIGLSLISFFEVLQFLYEVMHYLLYIKPKQKARLAKKRRMKQKQRAIGHVLRFSSRLLSNDDALQTVAGKLKMDIKNGSVSGKKDSKSHDGSLSSSESSSRNGKLAKTGGIKTPPYYDSVVPNNGFYNTAYLDYGRVKMLAKDNKRHDSRT